MSTLSKATKATEVMGAGEGVEDEAGRPGVSIAPSKNVVGEQSSTQHTGGGSRVRGGSLTAGGVAAVVQVRSADSGVTERPTSTGRYAHH